LDFTEDFNINVLGAVRAIQLCHLPLGKAGGASVVLFDTVAVRIGMGFHSSIAASKGALEGLARSLAVDGGMSSVKMF
jgi:3-oxoacyl-[acyl-carrier protein] reductase